MKLYVKNDTKPLCLPVAVAESTLELAMMLGSAKRPHLLREEAAHEMP